MANMPTLGSRDPTHIRRWVDALGDGQRRAPRCTARRRDGCPCRRLRLKGSTRCAVHCVGRERDVVDNQAIPRLRQAARWNNAVGRSARRRLDKIERRRLYRAWAKDPLIPGRTIALSPRDHGLVIQHLLEEHGISLNGLCPITAAPWTPRAVDRLTWCGVHSLSGHINHYAARQRIQCILRDEAAQSRKRQ